MKKATVRIPFEDLREGVTRNIGDTFICDDERGLYLNKLFLVDLQEAEEKEEVETKPTAKKAKKVKEG